MSVLAPADQDDVDNNLYSLSLTPAVVRVESVGICADAAKGRR